MVFKKNQQINEALQSLIDRNNGVKKLDNVNVRSFQSFIVFLSIYLKKILSTVKTLQKSRLASSIFTLSIIYPGIKMIHFY